MSYISEIIQLLSEALISIVCYLWLTQIWNNVALNMHFVISACIKNSLYNGKYTGLRFKRFGSCFRSTIKKIDYLALGRLPNLLQTDASYM